MRILITENLFQKLNLSDAILLSLHLKLVQKPLIRIKHSCLLIFPSIFVFLSLMSKQPQSLRDHQI